MQPFLVQFSVHPTASTPNEDTGIDRQTGLIHRIGSDRPLIEELATGTKQGNGMVATLLTETRIDSPDPDLVRQSLDVNASNTMATFQTRQGADGPDPDYVRFGLLASRYWAAFSSTMTKAEIDPADPDLVRFD